MLIQADARALPLPDGCVGCVVTSPPYFGLRDYGTARWGGGDSECDHSTARSRGDDIRAGDKQGTSAGSRPNTQAICATCGAERIDRQIGLERSPAEYVATMVEVFRELRRVLKDEGTVWLNLGDSYAGYWGDQKARDENRPSSADTNGWTNGFNMNARPQFDHLRQSGLKPKDLIGIPWRVAFALQADGWYLRSDIIWHKPNPMPESVTDRPTKAHEYLFLLSKSERYYYDADAIAEQGGLQTKPRPFGGQGDKRHNHDRNDYTYQGDTGTRNKRSVWTIPTMPYAGAHFATMPEKLVEPCILAGCPLGGLVLDPFSGSGTVLAVAERLGRRGVGVDLNPAYHALAKERTAQRGLRW